jgi:1-acyl-sn-glycerol-3-phosphate acyltransferase
MTQLLGSPELKERRRTFRFDDAGHGYDRFGLHPDLVSFADLVTSPVYERWFRVLSHGADNLPGQGPAILAANHSGTLPYDGAMLWADVYRHTTPPRAARAIADYFVPSLPLVGTTFARTGMVGGSPGNARSLLEAGELLMLFPEGTPGIGKPFSKRYQLQEWREGHAELSIRHRAPVIPVAIIGAEEQMPQMARLPGWGPVPYIPIPLTPIPLPVRYHIWYGKPLDLSSTFGPDAADDPAAVREAARNVRVEVEELLSRGLQARGGVFV